MKRRIPSTIRCAQAILAVRGALALLLVVLAVVAVLPSGAVPGSVAVALVVQAALDVSLAIALETLRPVVRAAATWYLGTDIVLVILLTLTGQPLGIVGAAMAVIAFMWIWDERSSSAFHPRPAPQATTRRTAPLLELDAVDVFYGRVQALKGISITVEEGEIVALIGSNGAGKTTTLHTISGLLHPASGEVRLHGEPIDWRGAEEIARLGIGHAPEGRRLFPRMTVRENLEMGAYNRRDRAATRQDFDRVYTLFPRLQERRSQLAGSLSGGEQQMVAIGRALMGSPSVLMLDEPSLGLAPILVDSIFEVIKEINAKGTTILLIEQNALLALNTATRGYVLETGRIAVSGSSKELLASPEVQRAYLGM